MNKEAVCALCGRVIPPHTGTFVQINSKEDPTSYILGHDKCGQIYGHSCATCKHQQDVPQCLINKYHGPLDVIKVVRIEQQLGPATIVQETPQVNPEVIEQVCPTCKCGSPWNCHKLYICDNWEIKGELKGDSITT